MRLSVLKLPGENAKVSALHPPSVSRARRELLLSTDEQTLGLPAARSWHYPRLSKEAEPDELTATRLPPVLPWAAPRTSTLGVCIAHSIPTPVP